MGVSVIERMCEYLGMKLAEWTRANDMRPQPACRWFGHGTLPDPEDRHRLGRVGGEDT
jgi:hypothetical protein